MVRFSLIAFVTALAAGPALGQSPVVPATTSVCLDVNGALLPVVCQVQGSRLDKRDTFCQCPEGSRADASVCAPGERPPVENLALSRARKIAGKDGTLVGDSFEGRRMCVDLSRR